MTVVALRNKLHEYINVADDRKIKAMYTMLEGEIKDTVAWWEDNDLIKKLDAEYTAAKSGTARTYSTEEVLEQMKPSGAKRGKK